MKEIKRKALKGLTLIELIVVMAIFSILLVAIIRFFSPVERIFRNTAINEKTYAYTNNIEELLETKLKYADVLWIFNDSMVDGTTYSAGSAGMDESDLQKIAQDMASTYYNGHIKFDGSSEHYAKGKIRILHLINSGSAFDIGQITERTVEFTCDPTAANKLIGTIPAEAATDTLVNDAYFKAGDSEYNFHYALGSGRLIDSTDTWSGNAFGKEGSTRTVDKDINDTPIDLSYENMNLCVVTTKQNSGSTYGFFGESLTATGYSVFANPCTLSVANLPLNNIVYCNNHTSAKRTLKITPTDTSGATIGSLDYFRADSLMSMVPESFRISKGSAKFTNDKMNFEDDIYFIYTYADELK